MSFPPGSFHVCLPGILYIQVSPILTLAMPAIVALAAPFLMDHRVASTFGAEIAGGTELTKIERLGSFAMLTIAIAVLFFVSTAVFERCLLSSLLHRLYVQFQRTRHRIRERTYLLHTKAHRAASADTAQLFCDLLRPVCLRERTENA